MNGDTSPTNGWKGHNIITCRAYTPILSKTNPIKLIPFGSSLGVSP